MCRIAGFSIQKQKIIVLALRFSRFYRGYGRKKPAKHEKVNQVAVKKAAIPHEFAVGSLQISNLLPNSANQAFSDQSFSVKGTCRLRLQQKIVPETSPAKPETSNLQNRKPQPTTHTI